VEIILKKSITMIRIQNIWNYSLDDFDGMISRILSIIDRVEKQESVILGLVKVSSAFAALSIHPQLNQKVNVFIALLRYASSGLGKTHY